MSEENKVPTEAELSIAQMQLPTQEELRALLNSKPRSFYFEDISGTGQNGRAKARIMLRYYDSFFDGTEREYEQLVFEKPILDVFAHLGFVNVRMDFKRNSDQDLRSCWELLERYSAASNSVIYLEEEKEKGYYVGQDGQEHMVYYPMVDLTISPIGKENQYVMLAVNPMTYFLRPSDLTDAPAVLELPFTEDTFFINGKPKVDMANIQADAMRELREEHSNI